MFGAFGAFELWGLWGFGATGPLEPSGISEKSVLGTNGVAVRATEALIPPKCAIFRGESDGNSGIAWKGRNKNQILFSYPFSPTPFPCSPNELR